MQKTRETIEFLEQTWLFGELISSPIQSQIAQNMTSKKYKKGEKIECKGLMLVNKGKVELTSRESGKQERQVMVKEGDFWGCEEMNSNEIITLHARANTSTTIYSITDIEILQQIPIVHWKMLEQTEKRE